MLAAIGPASAPAVPALILCLPSWHSGVRQAVARALARVGSAADLAVTALIQLLADREDEVREAAIAALAQVGKGRCLCWWSSSTPVTYASWMGGSE